VFPWPAQAISEIVQGSKRITAETALELSAALGTSAEVWLQLDAGYRLRLAEERPETAAVRRAIVKRSRERAKRDKFVISLDVANAFEERELPRP
jgi:plasmid maintenance system antidote protein VapI